jgi:hypothetical protein
MKGDAYSLLAFRQDRFSGGPELFLLVFFMAVIGHTLFASRALNIRLFYSRLYQQLFAIYFPYLGCFAFRHGLPSRSLFVAFADLPLSQQSIFKGQQLIWVEPC